MMKMFMTKKNISRKLVFREVDEDEIAMAEVLGLCAIANKKPRKERPVFILEGVSNGPCEHL